MFKTQVAILSMFAALAMVAAPAQAKGCLKGAAVGGVGGHVLGGHGLAGAAVGCTAVVNVDVKSTVIG